MSNGSFDVKGAAGAEMVPVASWLMNVQKLLAAAGGHVA
jgi:hypothetical protein